MNIDEVVSIFFCSRPTDSDYFRVIDARDYHWSLAPYRYYVELVPREDNNIAPWYCNLTSRKNHMFYSNDGLILIVNERSVQYNVLFDYIVLRQSNELDSRDFRTFVIDRAQRRRAREEANAISNQSN